MLKQRSGKASTSLEHRVKESKPVIPSRKEDIEVDPLFCSVTQGVVTAATGTAITFALRRVFISPGSLMDNKEGVKVAAATVASAPQPDTKPAHDVVAGAVARVASQGTIHPLDTMKVRMQAGPRTIRKGVSLSGRGTMKRMGLKIHRGLSEFRGLYRGVVGAASGAGIIIGTYFAFYSTTKKLIKEKTTLNDGSTAFVAGAAAALGSSVVKVPLAVCIRSVQAGVYQNVFHAAKSIVSVAGVKGLFTGFVPTILEDVPDMAVKFAVYESLRKLHGHLNDDRPATVAEDLAMGGFAGAAAAAATTPLDVIKTVMMCTASSRPTFFSAARAIISEGKGFRSFFRGIGPRALSNGLNSAIFFCFFEAIRQSLLQRKEGKNMLENKIDMFRHKVGSSMRSLGRDKHGLNHSLRPVGSAAASLSLALPCEGYTNEDTKC
jgi:solute carrier family 25 S-adenosylmethionine transporter 26